jgi:hypothetical protein
MKQPCLDCGKVSDGTRCPRCQGRHTKQRNDQQTRRRSTSGGRPQYGSGWAKLSRGLRLGATTCWVCGKGPDPQDPWQADHIIPAEKTGGGGGPVAAAHRSCNISRANKLRAGKPDPALTRQRNRGRRGEGSAHTTINNKDDHQSVTIQRKERHDESADL